MKIGIDARYAYRKEKRGIGNYIWHLLQELAKLKADHQYLLYVDKKAVLKGEPKLDTRFVICPIGFTSNPLIWEELILPRQANKDQVDLLHLTSNYGATFGRVKKIYTVHDAIEFRRTKDEIQSLSWRHRLGRAARTMLLPLGLKSANGFIADSQHALEDISQFAQLPQHQWVIPLGTDEDLYVARNIEKILRSYQLSTPYVLALGAKDPRKNTDLVMQIAEGMPEVHFVIVGHENPLDLAGSNIHFLGYVPREDLLALYQGAKVCLYPSLYEGFGIPPLEAMASGVPVMAMNRTSLPEVVGDAGLLMATLDVKAWRRQLLELLHDPILWQTYHEKGLIQAQRFQWQDTARHTLKAYEACL